MYLKKVVMAPLLIALCAGLLLTLGIKEEALAENSKPDWLIENTDTSITIIDGVGKKVTIPKPVKTTIANGMGEFYSTLRALGAEKMVVASNEYVSRNTAYYPQISRLPPIGTADQLDFELIFELNPDVIFCKPSFYSQFNKVILETFPIVQISFETLEDIKKLGMILDKREAAREYIDWIRNYVDPIDRKIASLEEDDYQEVFVFYGGEYGILPPPPYGTVGKQHLRNAFIRRAGGISLTENLDGWVITVDPEWIVEQDPPYIIRECYIANDHPEMGYSVKNSSAAKTLLKQIINRPAFSMSRAVKEKKALMIYGDLFDDSWFLGLAYLAKALQPNLFRDLDPVQMHQEFLTRFQKLDFDVRRQGLFTYSLR